MKSTLNTLQSHSENELLLLRKKLSIPLISGPLVINAFQVIDQRSKEFLHTHSDYEIYYCLQGVIKLRVRDEILYLQPNDLVIITPQLPHCVLDVPHSQWQFLICMFNPTKLKSYCESTAESEFLNGAKALFTVNGIRNEMLFIKDHRQCDELIRLIEKDFNERHLGWEVSVSLKITQFIMEVFRNRIPIPDNSNNENEEENIALLIDQYIHRNYMYDITAEDAASAFFMTSRNINRIIQQYLGVSFQKMLMLERFNRAKLFLIETEESIENISSMVGLNTVGSLYRLFRENEGLSPNEYRNMYK